MTTVECPYCEEYVEIDTDDHYEDYEEYECPNCSKNFEVFAEATVSYSVCYKADCLNGGEHKWKQKIGVPEAFFKGKYFCEYCSKEKVVSEELATDEEILKEIGSC